MVNTIEIGVFMSLDGGGERISVGSGKGFSTWFGGGPGGVGVLFASGRFLSFFNLKITEKKLMAKAMQ